MKRAVIGVVSGVVMGGLPGCGGESSGRTENVGAAIGASSGGVAGSATASESATYGTGASSPGGQDPGDSTPGNDTMPGDGIRLDIGSNPDVDPYTSEDCTKVDILFAIDNSGSMLDQQANLIQAFPGFVAGIRDTLKGTNSYHIGVVTSDNYAGNPGACPEIGDLVTQTAGNGSSSATCGPYASGFRWFDDTEADLNATFACAAQVGIDGDATERQVLSVLEATDPARNAPGACNEGFIRDDALLVVVLITDEDDRTGCGPLSCWGDDKPEAWFDRLVAHKSGIETNIVMLSLVGLSGQSCTVNATRIRDFGARFTNYAEGDICAGNYAEFFTDAISEIAIACEEFTPPG